jgi:hypothetical protein
MFPGAAPPPVDPRALRPRRAWYAVSVVIVVLGVLVGVGLFALGLVSAIRGLPKTTSEFESGPPLVLHLSAGRKSAIYLDSGASPPGAIDSQCSGRAEGDGSIDVQPTSYNFDFSSGRRHWRLLYTVEVSQDGRYELDCRPTDPTVETAHYAVGEDPKIGGFMAKLFGGIGALLGVPCLALVVGGVLALVVALRRNGQKKRLQATAYPPPGYPSPPGYP